MTALPSHPPHALCAEPGSWPASGFGLLPVPVHCANCLDEGFACEDHPEFPWEGIWGTVEGHAGHGGIGMPCPACCSPVPEDGAVSIAEAFVPDWRRTA